MFKLAICNELWGKKPIEEVFTTAAGMGFDGVEIAAFTLADSVDDIPAARRKEIVAAADDAGIDIVGLHWLLAAPAGLHVTTPDKAVYTRTVDYLKKLVDFCGDLGGNVMIFGSPKQRNVEPPNTHEAARARLVDALRAAAPVCQARGVTICFEALAPAETNIITTVDEAAALADEVNVPGIDIMIDVKAMASMPDGVIGTIKKHGARAKHFHANDPTKHGPGMGDNPADFKPILAALAQSAFKGWVSTEPFIYEPDPDTVARTAIKTLKAAMPD
ncbi:MAG: sugar phosphate isomerase/epimerase [Phycisphaerae bacterium]|nr:sugar phosphate isomerase/epimerase [Phycisphaerae bacterium]